MNPSDMICLHQRSGLWFPIDCARVDAEYDYMHARVTDVDAAVKRCKQRRVAVQAGGNVGMWPLRIAKFFDVVHTYEPVPSFFAALTKNTFATPKIVPHRALLSAKAGELIPFCERGDGKSRVVPEHHSNSSHVAVRIDDLQLAACDAIFLDVEGHELPALRGAADTIGRFRPVITVEFWEKNEADYHSFFASIDYVIAAKVHGDRIYIPK